MDLDVRHPRALLAHHVDGAGSGVEHRQDGAAGVAEGGVAGLAHAVVVEHRPGHGRVPVGEAEVAEPAGGRALQPAQVLHLQLDDRRLVRLGRGAPRLEGGVLGRRHVAVEEQLLARVPVEQPVPVEVGPARRVHEVGRLGHGLRAELGDEAGEARHRAQARREPVERPVVPAEVEVGVGPRAPEAREHARVRVDGTARVSAVQGPRHRAVEHVLVPRRQQHRRPQPQHLAPADGLPRLHVDGERLVVRAPQHDARVVAEEVDHGARLAHRGLAHAPAVAPLQREVLPEEEARIVGGVVQLRAGHVGVHAQQVEVGVEREVDVAPHLGRGRLRQLHARRPLVRSHDEERLAVHLQLPPPPAHLAERGAHRARGRWARRRPRRRPRGRSGAGRRDGGATTAAGGRRRSSIAGGSRPRRG